MTLVFVLVLGAVGLVVLFLAPWIGGAVLVAAVVLGAALLLVSLFRDSGDVLEEHDEQPEPPHLPGPGNPASGVD